MAACVYLFPEHIEFGIMFVCFSHQSVSNLKDGTIYFSLYISISFLARYLEPNRHFLFVFFEQMHKRINR